MIINSVIAGAEPITTSALSVTANGTYTAASGTAYSSVDVNVIPSSYTLKNYNVAPNATINAGDFVYYGTITVTLSSGSQASFYAVFPYGYDRNGSSGTTYVGIAKESGTAEAYTNAYQATVYIDCYMEPNVT